MAQVQESGPLVGQPMTDADWRDVLGGEAAIIGDTDGTAFKLTLPSASDIVEVGSATVRSIAVVGGYRLVIPRGSTQSLTIPASTDSSVGRTDVIAARLAPGEYTTVPGPVRLYRVPGTEGSSALPVLDEGEPGPELLPLWAVTRKAGQALNVAAVQDLRSWSGPTVRTARANLPSDVPIGTRVVRDGVEYLRTVSGASPAWVRMTVATADLVDSAVTTAKVAAAAVTPAKIDPTLKAAINGSCPVGMEAAFHKSPGSGWLELNGAAVSRTTYPDLFAWYGVVYGAGDGSSTFNLPNAKGRALVGLDSAQAEFNDIGKTGGAKTHTLSTAEMPSHTHTSAAHTHSIPSHTHTINHDHASVTSSSAGAHTHGSSSSGITDRAYFARGSAPASSATVGTNGVTPGPWDYVVSSTLASAGAHTHTVNLPNFTGTSGSWSGTSGSTTPGASGSTGGGGAHNNLPPYLVRRWYVRALPVLA